MYLVFIRELKGVEMVLSALRATKNIASCDLADGIEKNLHYMEQDGTIMKLSDVPQEISPVEVDRRPNLVPLFKKGN